MKNDIVATCLSINSSLNAKQKDELRKVAEHVRKTGDVGLFYLLVYADGDAPSKSLKETPLE